MITFDDVQAAARRLDGVAHRTPVITSGALDEATGAGRVLLKAENLQRVGAFKFRGAYNAVSTLSPEDRRRGVATVSSGNHAQAVSLAARLHEIPAVILMPEDAPAGKLAATRGYGAEVVLFDRYGVGARRAAGRAGRRTRPHTDPSVRQPVRDGRAGHRGAGADRGRGPAGRAAGLPRRRRAAVRLRDRDRRAVARTRGSSASSPRRATTSCAPSPPASGSRIEVPRTIADGQQTNIPGELTFPVIQKLVDEVITVSDAEIVAAMKLLFERAKVVAEPSGACAFAALLAGKVEAKGLRVGVTISGGNVTAARFAELVRLSAAALAMVLASAVLHAGWNALVAGAKDTHATAAVAMLTGVVVFAIPAALTWRVEAEAWPFIAASAALELAYFALLAATYSRADYSFAYPVARGSAPILVLLISTIALGADISPLAIVGILAVTGGVLLVRGVGTEAVDKTSLLFALGVGACIAGYTLVDDRGVEHAAPIPYFEIVLLLSAIPYALVVGHERLRKAVDRRSLPAGVGMAGAYILVLAALERAPAAPGRRAPGDEHPARRRRGRTAAARGLGARRRGHRRGRVRLG